jgi:hypothetical protein
MGQSSGQGNISVNQKQAAAGAPFPAGSANNGLSVDPVTGAIVLGSDPGTPAPGQLLSDRRIEMNGNNFSFTDALGTWDIIELDTATDNYRFGRAGVFNTGCFIDIRAAAPEISLMMNQTERLLLNLGVSAMGDVTNAADGSTLQIDHFNETFSFINAAGLQRSLFFDPTNGMYFFGETLGGGNGTVAELNDGASTFDLSNTTLTAVYSINGNPGVSGTFAPPLSITVEGGIITAIS